MTLDKQALGRLVHNQLQRLMLGKYGTSAVQAGTHDLWEKRGMTTLEFMRHFIPLNDVINKWEPREIPDAHIPALLVTPFSLVEIGEQMERIELNGTRGGSPLRISDIKNLEEGIPTEPYLLIDVENGKERINHVTEMTERILKERGRHPLTVNEGVAYLTYFPEILQDDYIFELAGSRYRNWAGQFEDIGECYTARPVAMLDFKTPRVSVYLPEGIPYDENWGVPSCAMRIDPKKY